MKKRICAVFLSLAMFATLLLPTSAAEIANYKFESGESPITCFWTGNGKGDVEMDNGRLKLHDDGDGGLETSNFYAEQLDDFTLSMLYYPSGDWFVDNVYFHWVDSNNYYAVQITGKQCDEEWAANTRRTVKLFRMENGTKTEVASTQLADMSADGNIAYSLKIVDKKGDIKVWFAQGETLPADAALTYTDAAPLATGYIKMNKYCYVSWIDNVVISVPDSDTTTTTEADTTTTTEADTTTTTEADTTTTTEADTTTTAPEDKSDPVNPVVKYTFDKATDVTLEDTSNMGGAMRWEGGKLKIFAQTVGGSGANVRTPSLGGDEVDLKDFTWEFDYQPEYLSWNVDTFCFHMAGNDFDNSLQLRILGNDAAGLTKDVNTTGGGEAHNVKLIMRRNGVNTLLGSYNLPYGLELVNYSVRIVMKDNNIKVWFAPKSEGLKKAVIDCDVENLPEEMTSGHFVINSYFGNYLIDNVSIWNTASPNHLTSSGTSANPSTGVANTVQMAIVLIACASLVALVSFSSRKKVCN